MCPIARLFTSGAALSAWMVLLFLGHPLKGAVHLLIVVAVLLLPRRPAEAGESR